MLRKTIILLYVLPLMGTSLFGQTLEQWGISACANYSQPVGGLSDWFQSTTNFGISAGQQIREDWFVEGLIEYTKYDQENTIGYAKDHVRLELEHTGILVNGKYTMVRFSKVRTFFNLGGGLYYWKGTRGKIEANPGLNPALPYIEQKVLEEWNWGFRSGLGIEYQVSGSFALEMMAYYRLIIGDLWPTLQPHIELEGVSGFQSVNLSIFLRYYF